MPKMLELALTPGACGDSCQNGVTRPITAVSDSAGFAAGTREVTSDGTLTRGAAALVRRLEAGILRALGLARELVDLDIGRASEYGARWWSRRLVEMYEDAGFVRLDN